MGDLISRSALIEELHHMIEWDVELKQDYEYLGIDDCIRSMPTAYDIEKVVEELEEVGNQRLEDAFGGREEWEALAYRQGTRKAIEIVRKGGVE